MMMMMQQQQQQQQGQGAAGTFSPPPNVTAPTGMDNPMGPPPMNQPGQQAFNYGGNYGELTETEPAVCILCHILLSHSTTVALFAGMNQQGDPAFMTPGCSPPGNIMPGRMGGPPQNAMMPGMQGNPQGGHSYPSGDLKGWPQGGMPRNMYAASGFL